MPCSYRGAHRSRFNRRNLKTFTCPFHGWTFSNTGKLLKMKDPIFSALGNDIEAAFPWECDEDADLANWMIPGKPVKGMGGAVVLVAGVGRVVVVMDHTSKAGEAKLRKECTLPLTGKGAVDRIVTNLGVVDVTPKGLQTRECAPGVTRGEIVAATEAAIV